MENMEHIKEFWKNESERKLESFKETLAEKLKVRYKNFKGLIACDSKGVEDYKFLIRTIFEELKESGIEIE